MRDIRVPGGPRLRRRGRGRSGEKAGSSYSRASGGTLRNSGTLLAGATDDARSRAEEIAGRSGARLGRMITARAGVFQITEPYSTEVSGYGMYNTASRAKEMTVTVHAEFELR